MLKIKILFSVWPKHVSDFLAEFFRPVPQQTPFLELWNIPPPTDNQLKPRLSLVQISSANGKRDAAIESTGKQDQP